MENVQNAKHDIKPARYHLLNINLEEPAFNVVRAEVRLCWSILCPLKKT